jgi:glycosyltransferase involved in cell wall biosynthesis
LNLKNYQEQAKKFNPSENLNSGSYVSDLGATIHRLPVLFSIGNRNWWEGYVNLLIDLKPNILIVHSILEFQTLRLIYFINKINCKLIIDDHTTINVIRNGISGSFVYFLFRFFFSNRLYSIANKIIGISDSCITVINDYMGLKGEKVIMIPLGTDSQIFYPDLNKRELLRRELILQDNTLLIVYTGKVYDEKKVHLIIDVLNEINSEGNLDLVIYIVGTVYENYKNTLNSHIKNSLNRVILEDNVSHDKLSYIYNAADISVWPAHTTTSTLDASACGCPIICSDYKTERYRFKSGLGVIDGDCNSLKKALKILIDDRELRLCMGKNGINMTTKFNSWEKIANDFIN